ncbi:hypothetical protein ACNGJF_08355 [Campylobacter jejuni]|nr:hypothetical protein [Campylobacter jejuni]
MSLREMHEQQKQSSPREQLQELNRQSRTELENSLLKEALAMSSENCEELMKQSNQEQVRAEQNRKLISELKQSVELLKNSNELLQDAISGLHDMRVKKIIIQDKTIVLEFEDGYEKLTEPFEQVEGNITIEGVDFDCTCVMLQSKWGNYGKFNGEKLELERFIKRYKNYSFEIVDELYGYNQVLYSGYLSILETEDLVQMDISIYFTGKIIYDTKE